MTFDEAVENAARVLRIAEGETNLATMAQLVGLADSWIAIANQLRERERA